MKFGQVVEEVGAEGICDWRGCKSGGYRVGKKGKRSRSRRNVRL